MANNRLPQTLAQRQVLLVAFSWGRSEEEGQTSWFPVLRCSMLFGPFPNKAEKSFFPMLWPKAKANIWTPNEHSRKTACLSPDAYNTNCRPSLLCLTTSVSFSPGLENTLLYALENPCCWCPKWKLFIFRMSAF